MEIEKKSNGALLGSIIIIIILIIGGVYIWQSKVQKVLDDKKAESGVVIQMDANELNALEQSLDTDDSGIEIDVDSLN